MIGANPGLRLACADILDGLAPVSPWPYKQPRPRGADMLRWAERFQHGEPVSADEHDTALREAEEARHEAERAGIAHEAVLRDLGAAQDEIKKLRDVVSAAAKALGGAG